MEVRIAGGLTEIYVKNAEELLLKKWAESGIYDIFVCIFRCDYRYLDYKAGNRGEWDLV